MVLSEIVAEEDTDSSSESLPLMGKGGDEEPAERTEEFREGEVAAAAAAAVLAVEEEEATTAAVADIKKEDLTFGELLKATGSSCLKGQSKTEYRQVPA